MFKKIKRSQTTTLLIFFIEAFLITCFGICLFTLDLGEFVEANGMYILLGLCLVSYLINLLMFLSIYKKNDEFILRSDITIASLFGTETTPAFEFGSIAIIVYDENDSIVWLSQSTLIKKEDVIGKKIYNLIEDFDEKEKIQKEEDIFTTINGKTFQLLINNSLRTVFLKDVTRINAQAEKIENERPFIGHITIDNYQDIVSTLDESDFVLYVSQVKEAIAAFAKKYHLVLRQYSNESALIFGEDMFYNQMSIDGFTLLNDVRALREENDNPLTISIGIGRGVGAGLLKISELSYNALSIALSRGGNQAVIYTFGEPLQYVGAKTEIRQTRSHVRGRVLADSLATYIKDASNIIIMGHQNMDFDAMGSALGVYSIAKNYQKEAYIVYIDDLIESQTKQAFKQTFTHDEINEITIAPSRALQIIDEDTLVVVVDTHVPNRTMFPQLLNKVKNIAVIDHHRRSDTFISSPIYQYHEPQSSSASELVTEIIYYQPQAMDIDERVANFLLAGICLDTKFFRSLTSSKTFEMAMVLKNYQANVDEVNEYFKQEFEEMMLQNSFIKNTHGISTSGIYLSYADDNDIVTRSSLAKAAEEIINVRDAKAVFVIGRTGSNEISVSARSLNDFNVQLIMESMGGGGHFSKAACQLTNSSIQDAVNLVIDKVNVFIRDGKL